MPLAVTHVLLTIIAIDIFRDYIIKKKRLIPLNFLFIGGLAVALIYLSFQVNKIDVRLQKVRRIRMEEA